MDAVVNNAMADQQNAEIERTVRTERGRLFNFIRKRVRHEDDAEDILQDVLWQFIEAYRRLETIERVTSWLFQVARKQDRGQLPQEKSGDLASNRGRGRRRHGGRP